MEKELHKQHPEVLEQLTFDEMTERMREIELKIFYAKMKPLTRMAYQQLWDRLYSRCVQRIDNVLSDATFMVFLSLDDAKITINP